MSNQIIRSNYDAAILVRIRRDSAYLDLTGATVKASLIDATKANELITDTVLLDSAENADWPNGLIAVDFTAAQTTALVPGKAFIEIAITLGGKKLPVNHVPVEVEKGWTVS
jgi:hypothetical protein